MDLTPGPERYSLPGHDREAAEAMLNQARLRHNGCTAIDDMQVMHLLQIGFRAGERAGREAAEQTEER